MSRALQFKRLLALDLAPIRKQSNRVSPLAEQLMSHRQVRLTRGSHRRNLNFETLEQRAMFAAPELVMNSLLPETVREMETSTIVWQGENRSVNAGHLFVRV